VRIYPHDPAAFTQGLVYLDGALYEGTGLEGRSSIRKVQLATGKVLQNRALSAEFFGEGITNWRGRLLQLTWRSQVGFVYDLTTFRPLARFEYKGEGWGLTNDGRRLIMSDGTARLRFLDPATLRETGAVTVTDEGRPVPNLNELEFVKGEVLANIWMTDRLARIDPESGKVTGWIDLTGLLSPADRRAGVDVLNGIAYDAARDRIFVTGKLWPKLFEIDLVPPGAP
jgi:glutamine cyclotransferase